MSESVEKDNYQYGIALLRAYMCFQVVCIHFWNNAENSRVLAKGVLSYCELSAVAVFMILAFWFSEKGISSGEAQWIKKRMVRLVVPQVGWTLIYGLALNLFDIVFGTHFTQPIDILWQLVTGHSPNLNATMWFQTVLIWLTLLFFVMVKLFPKNNELAFVIIGGVALVLEYSGSTLSLKQTRYEIQYPAGRFFEMIPLAVLGLMVSKYHILDRLRQHRLTAVIIATGVLVLDYKWQLFSSVNGFGNAGIRLMVLALCFIIIAYCIPFENVTSSVKVSIRFMTRFTLGIYCLHRLVGIIIDGVISRYNLPVEADTFTECIAIYVICYIICWAGSTTFNKTKIKMMFD